MTVVAINPGTGPVWGTYLKNAWKNIRIMRRELFAAGHPWLTVKRHNGEHEDGRYLFEFRHKRKRCEVWMPGLPIDRVRFISADGQNPWDFPRLLIGEYGNSWLWMYAVGDVESELGLDR